MSSRFGWLFGFATALATASLILFSAGRNATAQQADSFAARLADSGCFSRGTSRDLMAAIAKCPPVDPILTIERPINNAKINKLAADPKCTVIATASEDKTAHVFRGDGSLLHILRPPISMGNAGKLRAVAVSPDARFIAVAGWDVPIAGTENRNVPTATNDNRIYIFDAVSGVLLRNVGGAAYDFKGLAYSLDGTRLAATYGQSVIVYDTKEFSKLFQDDSLSNLSYALSFAEDGSLFLVTTDGNVRKYRPDGRVLASKSIKNFGTVAGMTVHPSGAALALASVSEPGVAILDGKSLEVVGRLDETGLAKIPLGIIAGSSTGAIAAGGMLVRRDNGVGVVRIWEAPPQSRFVDLEVKDDSVGAMAPCGNDFLIATISPTLQRVDTSGKVAWRIDNTGMTAFEKTAGAFRVSADATRLWFGLDTGQGKPVEFDLGTERLFASVEPARDLSPPQEGPLPVAGWKEGANPTLSGRSLAHDPNELFRALAQEPEGKSFVLGSDFQLWHYDRRGQPIWRVKTAAAVHGVNIPASGRVVVTAQADSTLRWYRLKDGAELLSAYIDKSTLQWIAWTPSGYFICSPGGDAFAGWHLNRGFGKAADFFPLSRFRERFYRPDIVKRILKLLDEPAAIEEADQARGIIPQPLQLFDQLPPVIKIIAPQTGTAASTRKINLEFELRSPSGLPIDAIDVLLDGRPSGTSFRPAQPPVNGDAIRGTYAFDVPGSPSGAVEIGLVARTGNVSSVVSRTNVTFSTPPSPDDVLKPKLFALVVGVSDYQADRARPLQFAAKDAQDLKVLLERQTNDLYGPVEVKLLDNANATREKIKQGLEWLDENVTRHDVGLIFLAGHGRTDEQNRFWFITSDAEPDKLAQTALAKDDLDATVRSLRGRVIVMLDACHSGNATSDPSQTSDGGLDVNSLVGDLTASGQDLVIFSSSSGRELSFESADWGNGAFTKAVIEAIALGKADLFKSGRVSASLLDAYAVKRVSSLTQGRQHPLMFRPRQAADFDIAAVR